MIELMHIQSKKLPLIYFQTGDDSHQPSIVQYPSSIVYCDSVFLDVLMTADVGVGSDFAAKIDSWADALEAVLLDSRTAF
jgi:hypothetical protein